jgi:hypothetical protein
LMTVCRFSMTLRAKAIKRRLIQHHTYVILTVQSLTLSLLMSYIYHVPHR